MRPEDSTANGSASIRAFMTRLQRRARLHVAAEAVCVAAGIALLGGILTRIPASAHNAGITAAVLLAAPAAAGAWAWRRRKKADVPALAAQVERHNPSFRNTLITALELSDHPGRASAQIAALVFARAADALADVEPSTLFRGRRLVLLLAGAITMASGGLALLSAPTGVAATPSGIAAPAAPSPRSGRIARLTVGITPPAYAGRPAESLIDPERVQVLQGSRIEVHVSHDATRVEGALNGQPLASAAPDGVSFPAESSGALTISAIGEDGGHADRRLIAIQVVPDNPPQVWLEHPGTDLVVPDAARRIRFAARANDDLGLASLELHYTRVSGSGEQYTFEEGRLPWPITRGADGTWRAEATHALSGLGLGEGDVLVYHARAADRVPGREPARSDSFVIEIGSPQAAIAGGFAVPPDEERQAISLQALIRKTEALDRRRGTLAADAFAEAAAGLAVEQRMVRTETLFMMGSHGHIEDEEEEAEQSHEIQEGRLENRGHAALLAAVRLMTEAERSLLASNTRAALVAQRRALTSLQRALSRQRYFLRTVPTRSQIDLTRRGSGDLADARSWNAPVEPDDTDTASRPRSMLARLAALASAAAEPDAAAWEPAAVTGLAASILALDPESAVLQDAARGLAAAAARGVSAAARRQAAGTAAAAVAATGERRTSPAAPPAPAGPLPGAFVDELRAGGRP